MTEHEHIAPKTGLAGLVQNWQSDLLAALSVSLVALPLALGIAYASGVPPITGITSAIIAGVVATIFRGSHLAINGPAAGLIAVILSSIAILDDGSGNVLGYVYAAIVVAGGIQVMLGALRFGRFADIFHPTVIQGILAAIGVIIFAKQIHVALGTTPSSTDIFQTLKDVYLSLGDINPFVAFISLIGLILLVFQSKINYKLFHIIPAPVWVMGVSIPLVFAFDFFSLHDIELFGHGYEVGPSLLVSIPDNILASITYPDFSRVGDIEFWGAVVSITLIASILSLAGSKAVDMLDPYRRRTDLNKDLIGTGLSTIVAGLVGGLPIITVIVRSTVNVNNHAKTRWSNFYHGLILLAFIFLLAPVIQKVPLAALAIILVYAGYRLASPKVFGRVYGYGIEQLIIFTGTMVTTLMYNLLIGLLCGLTLALLIHYLMAKIPVTDFFKSIFRSGSHLVVHQDGSYDLRLKGIANFLTTLKLEKLLDQVPMDSHLVIDLSATRLVDFSVMSDLHDFRRNRILRGGSVDIRGLDEHISSSDHRLGMKVQTKRLRQATGRQLSLLEMSLERDWKIDLSSDDQTIQFKEFYFFQNRLILNRFNRIIGSSGEYPWELCDLNFQEGSGIAAETFKTTVGMLRFPDGLPRFTIEKMEFLDRYLLPHKDIDYSIYSGFSDDFRVKVENIEEMDSFLTEELRTLIEGSTIEHLESDGSALLIFSQELTKAEIPELSSMVDFLEEMISVMTRRESKAMT